MLAYIKKNMYFLHLLYIPTSVHKHAVRRTGDYFENYAHNVNKFCNSTQAISTNSSVLRPNHKQVLT